MKDAWIACAALTVRIVAFSAMQASFSDYLRPRQGGKFISGKPSRLGP